MRCVERNAEILLLRFSGRKTRITPQAERTAAQASPQTRVRGRETHETPSGAAGPSAKTADTPSGARASPSGTLGCRNADIFFETRVVSEESLGQPQAGLTGPRDHPRFDLTGSTLQHVAGAWPKERA